MNTTSSRDDAAEEILVPTNININSDHLKNKLGVSSILETCEAKKLRGNLEKLPLVHVAAARRCSKENGLGGWVEPWIHYLQTGCSKPEFFGGLLFTRGTTSTSCSTTSKEKDESSHQNILTTSFPGADAKLAWFRAKKRLPEKAMREAIAKKRATTVSAGWSGRAAGLQKLKLAHRRDHAVATKNEASSSKAIRKNSSNSSDLASAEVLVVSAEGDDETSTTNNFGVGIVGVGEN